MAGRISEYFKIRKQEKEEFIAFLEDVKHKISVAGQEYQELFRNPSAYVVSGRRQSGKAGSAACTTRLPPI